MRRWFLSYNSQDLALMQRLEAALRQRDLNAKVFFAPTSLRAGGFWLPDLAKGIGEATAFVLLVGEKGLGPWQVIEYYEAPYGPLSRFRRYDRSGLEFSSAEGPRQSRLLGRTSERAKLAKGCNFPSFAMTVTRRRPDKDLPHGMPTTQADTINADLLAFPKA